MLYAYFAEQNEKSMHNHSHGHQDIHLGTTLVFCSIINLLYVAIEAGVGFKTGSASLVSDAGHNLSDVLTLLLTLVAITTAAKRPGRAHAIGIINALLLIAAVVIIAIEGVEKLLSHEPIEGAVISITAGVGIIVNGLTALLLMKDRHGDTNVRASFLHMLSDTLVSVGVVISGLVISWTGWTLIDPILSLSIAVIILIPAIGLLKESFR